MVGLLISFAAVGAAGRDRDAASSVPAGLAFVASCSRPGDAADYRVLVFQRGFEHVSSEVHLQWLAWDEAGPRVVASARVEELSSGMWSIGEPVLVSKRACSFLLAATQTYASEDARFVLRPVGRGRYELRRRER